MASSKSNISTNTGLRDTTSDTNDEEKDELCPGFKDVDAFVKVSELTKLVFKFRLAVRWATWMCLLATAAVALEVS